MVRMFPCLCVRRDVATYVRFEWIDMRLCVNGSCVLWLLVVFWIVSLASKYTHLLSLVCWYSRWIHERMQRNDCRWWMQIWNKETWKEIQQSTCYQKRDRDELESREHDELGLQSLSRGFRLRLQNQSLIGKPNIRQSKWDSTINQRKSVPKNILIASAKKDTIATIVISNFSGINPAKLNPKNNLLNMFGSSITTFPSTVAAFWCLVVHSSAESLGLINS